MEYYGAQLVTKFNKILASQQDRIAHARSIPYFKYCKFIPLVHSISNFHVFLFSLAYRLPYGLIWRVLGLGSRLQEIRPTIQARGGGGSGVAPQLSALFSLAYRLA